MYVHLSVHLSVFLLDYVILFLLAMPHFCFLDSGKPTGEICGPNDKCWGNGRCLSRCCEKYLATADKVAECDNNGYAKRCKSGFELQSRSFRCRKKALYTTVSSGASCEAVGFARIPSLADCKNALQELRQSHSPKGTVHGSFGPRHCYLRYDGDLWYNLNGQSTTPCSSASNCVCRIEQCKMENNIDYNGNDDKMPNGKLKCSSPIKSLCTQRNPIDDVPSCKSFCSTSKYFTWKASKKECYCKNSDSRRRQHGGSVSGKTNCPYSE